MPAAVPRPLDGPPSARRRRPGRLRVAMVSEHASPLAALGGADAGGQNVHVDALARTLAARGVEVEVFTRRDDPALPERVAVRPGVTVVHVEAGPAEAVPKDDLLPFMGEFARQLSAAWRRSRPGLVHTHFWMSGLAGTIAAQPLDIPVVHTFHALGVVKRREQGAADTSPPERLGIEQRLLRDVDQVIATGSDEAFELMRLGLPAERISIVPCGVDLELFTMDGPAEERRSDRDRIVVVTRLVERKGVGNVVEALARLPETELIVAGGPDRRRLRSDPEARRLRAVAEAHGVADRVELRGRVPHDEVPRLLRSADVVATCPWYEPFGIVPVEAMACGVPVVASAVGGMLDTVVDGMTGLLVPPRCPERIAEAVGELLADPARRGAMGSVAADRARRYGWDRVGALTLGVYRGVLSLDPIPVTWPGQLAAAGR
jgi:D-inositol-3-phosphate glycosyltransferase